MCYRHIWVFLFILLLWPAVSVALEADSEKVDEDKYSFEFKGTPLSEVLEYLGGQTGVDLIFDPKIVEGYEVYKRVSEKTMEETLSLLLDETGLDYIILSSGTFVVIRSSRRDPVYGAFAGKVYDHHSGEPLPGATIMLADANGGTVSGNSGHFSLGKLKSGTYDIIFSYVGYEPVKMTVSITPEGQHREEVALQPTRFQLNPIVVTDHYPLIPVSHVQETETQASDKWMTGHGTRSVIHDLTLFNGIQHGIPLVDIHMQGGQSGDHRFFLDNVPVYNPYSFGRLYSAFSPYAIGRVSVEKAGFGPSSGSYIAGKVNLNHSTGRYAGQTAVLQADPLNTNVRISHTAGNNRLRLMAALRHSFWDWFQDPALSDAIGDWDFVDPLTYSLLADTNEESPVFQSLSDKTDIRFRDLHFAGDYRVDRYRNLSFSVYHGNNFLETDLLAESDVSSPVIRMFSRDRYEWQNLISQIRYDWMVTPRVDLRFQASYSANKLEHSYAMFGNTEIANRSESATGSDLFQLLVSEIEEVPAQADENIIRHTTLRTDLDYSVSSKSSLSGGIQYEHIASKFDLAGLFYLPALNEQTSHLLSTYINADRRVTGNLGVNFGSRLTYFDPAENVYAEPRASIQYDKNNSILGYWSVKLSGGIYRQFVNQFQITNVGPSALVPNFTAWYHSDDIKQPISYNSSLDLVLEPASNTTIRLESYLKIQPDAYITSYHNLLLADDADRRGIRSFAEQTRLRAYGGGVRLHQTFLEDDLQLFLSYDFSKVEIDYETQFGRVLPAPWNEPHRFQMRILGHVRSDFSIIARWQGVVGRKWGFRQSYYDFLTLHDFTGAGEFSFMNPERDQLSPFHQVDVSLVYHPSLPWVNIEFRADLINIFNRRNEIDWNLQPTGSDMHSPNGAGLEQFEIRSRRMPGFTPSLSVKLGL